MVERHVVQPPFVHGLQADLAGACGVHDLGDDFTVGARRHEHTPDVAATAQRFENSVPAVQDLADRPLPTCPKIWLLVAVVKAAGRTAWSARVERPAAGVGTARASARRATRSRSERARTTEAWSARRWTTRTRPELTRTTETGATARRATRSWTELSRTTLRRAARARSKLARASLRRAALTEGARHPAVHQRSHLAGVLRTVDAAGARSHRPLLVLAVVTILVTGTEAAATVAASLGAGRTERTVSLRARTTGAAGPERPVTLWARTTQAGKRPAALRRASLAGSLAFSITRTTTVVALRPRTALTTVAAGLELRRVFVAVMPRPRRSAGLIPKLPNRLRAGLANGFAPGFPNGLPPDFPAGFPPPLTLRLLGVPFARLPLGGGPPLERPDREGGLEPRPPGPIVSPPGAAGASDQ